MTTIQAKAILIQRNARQSSSCFEFEFCHTSSPKNLESDFCPHLYVHQTGMKTICISKVQIWKWDFLIPSLQLNNRVFLFLVANDGWLRPFRNWDLKLENSRTMGRAQDERNTKDGNRARKQSQDQHFSHSFFVHYHLSNTINVQTKGFQFAFSNNNILRWNPLFLFLKSPRKRTDLNPISSESKYGRKRSGLNLIFPKFSEIFGVRFLLFL